MSEYLSSEFAKPVPNDKRHEYKISGAFTKIMFALGVQGIVYPTAQDRGKGFNRPLAKLNIFKIINSRYQIHS